MKKLVFVVLSLAVLLSVSVSAEAVQYRIVDLGLGEATGINASGQVVGHSYIPNSYSHAFIWQNESMNDLGSLDGYDGIAYGINNNGQVAGCSVMSSGYTHAFIWQNERMIDLGTLGGGGSTGMPVINSSGQVVGYSDISSAEIHAFTWQNEEMTDLGTLGGCSFAYALNDNGWIAGVATNADGNRHAVLWQPVPEPSSILALLCGIGSFAGLAVRRRVK